MAHRVLQGAQQCAEVKIRFKKAFTADLQDLLWSDGIIIGSPENFGYMSGAIKNFFDRTYYPAQNKFVNKPYGIFISCENDGTGAVNNIQRIAKGYPLKQVIEPIICKGNVNPDALQECFDMGLAMATGLSMGIYWLAPAKPVNNISQGQRF